MHLGFVFPLLMVVLAQAASPENVGEVAVAVPLDHGALNVTFINVCYSAVSLYWLHSNGLSEEFVTMIPPDHQMTQSSYVGHVFRIKWADDSNRGIFGEDIIEEYTIEDLGVDEQVIKICLLTRQREERIA